jgi:hypothetical protein
MTVGTVPGLFAFHADGEVGFPVQTTSKNRVYFTCPALAAPILWRELCETIAVPAPMNGCALVSAVNPLAALARLLTPVR